MCRATDDDVRFDVSTLRVLGTGDGGVPGGAVTCVAQLGNRVVKFKADVGFYAPEHIETLEEADYPSLLLGQLLPTRILRQPIEYAIADKIHAAVQHAGENTRMRDYYDLYVFCTRKLISDDVLAIAFAKSLPLYSSDPIPEMEYIQAYGEDFAAANGDAWDSMRSTLRLPVAVPDLETVCRTIRDRIGPVLETINGRSWGCAA